MADQLSTKKESLLPLVEGLGENDLLRAIRSNQSVNVPFSSLQRGILKFAQGQAYELDSLLGRAKNTVWVTDAPFSAKMDGVTDDGPAFRAALAWLRANGGGTLMMPEGVLRSTSGGYSCYPIVGVGFHDINIVGAGRGATILDFTGSAANSGGLKFHGWGGRIGIRGFQVKNAQGVGIDFNPTNRDGQTWISRSYADDILITGCESDGLRNTQTYMCHFGNIESVNNKGYGGNFRGFHTSISMETCWFGGDAVYPNGGNLAGGLNMNGFVYSSLVGVGADNNGGPGYTGKALCSVVFSGCGAEANAGSGALFISDDLDIDNIPIPGINNVVLQSFFATGNGLPPSTSCNSIELRANGRRASILAIGCNDLISGAGSNVSIGLYGTGAEVAFEEIACGFKGSRIRSGITFTRNGSIQGRTATVKLSADFLVPDGTATTVPFNTFDSNTLGAANIVGTTGELVIPAGVNRIRVMAGLFWNTNSVGARTLTVLRTPSGGSTPASFFGAPSQKNVANGFTTQQVSSAVFEVAAGDKIIVQVTQNSGGNLSVIANTNTYLSVEAVG